MLYSVFMLALRSVRRNMLRSFLTILGIVIGVSAVITMVTLGNGATQAIQMQITSLGTNLLMVMPGQRTPGGGGGGGGGVPQFTEADAEAMHDADRRRRRRGAARPCQRDGGGQWPQLGHQRVGSTNAWFVTGNWKLASRPPLRARRTTRRCGGVHHRRNGAARDLRRHRRAAPAWASNCASSSSRAT
jgi:putative ABC transport system permease protein